MFSMVKRGESCARPLATFSVHSERHEPGTCMPACQQFLSSMLLSNMLLWATSSGRALPLASDTSWQKLRNSAMPTCALNGCDKDSHTRCTPTTTHTDTQCTAAGRISALDLEEDPKPPHCTAPRAHLHPSTAPDKHSAWMGAFTMCIGCWQAVADARTAHLGTYVGAPNLLCGEVRGLGCPR